MTTGEAVAVEAACRLESELRGLEEALAAALTRRDLAMLSRMFAPDYSFVSAAGERWGRERAIADFADPRLTVRHVGVRVEGAVALHDVGLVTGRSEVDGEIGERSLSGVFGFAHVWRRFGERWQIASEICSKATTALRRDASGQWRVARIAGGVAQTPKPGIDIVEER